MNGDALRTLSPPAHGGGIVAGVGIVASDWEPVEKNTLRGFCTLTFLRTGLRIHRCALHTKGNARWIAFPAREWTGQDGAKRYAILIEFANRAAKDRFQRLALAAVDQLLAAAAGGRDAVSRFV
jgi:hypothetical protein